MNRIEMRLESFMAAGLVTLQDQIGRRWGIGNRDLQPNIFVVASERSIDLCSEHALKTWIRQLTHVELGPSRLLESSSHTATIPPLESPQRVKRFDHLLTQPRIQILIVSANEMVELVNRHGPILRASL